MYETGVATKRKQAARETYFPVNWIPISAFQYKDETVLKAVSLGPCDEWATLRILDVTG